MICSRDKNSRSCTADYKNLQHAINSISLFKVVSFYARVMFLNNVGRTHKLQFKTVYFLRVWGLPTSPCKVYDYTTSVHTHL